MTERDLQYRWIVRVSLIRYHLFISVVLLGLGSEWTFCQAFLRGGKRIRRSALLWDLHELLVLSASFLHVLSRRPPGCYARADSTPPSVHSLGLIRVGDLGGLKGPRALRLLSVFGKEKSAWYIYGWRLGSSPRCSKGGNGCTSRADGSAGYT